jgi:hypothetical protein
VAPIGRKTIAANVNSSNGIRLPASMPSGPAVPVVTSTFTPSVEMRRLWLLRARLARAAREPRLKEMTA